MTGAFSPKDDAYYEQFFNAVAELIPYIEDTYSHIDVSGITNLLNLTIGMYEGAKHMDEYDDRRAKHLHNAEQKAVMVINEHNLQNRLEKFMENQPEVVAEHTEEDFSEDWQDANKWVNTMKAEMTDEEIIMRAKALVEEGGRNEKEKKDIEMLEGYIKYGDINGMKTIIDSLPQGHAMAFKSEGWFNTLKEAGAVTTTSPGQSALQNVAYGKPKNKHGQKKDEEEEYPIILEETDFWRD